MVVNMRRRRIVRLKLLKPIWGASKLVESLESIDVDGLSMQGSISREVSLGALEWWKPPQSGLYNYVV